MEWAGLVGTSQLGRSHSGFNFLGSVLRSIIVLVCGSPRQTAAS